MHTQTYIHGNVGLQTAGTCSTYYTIVLHALKGSGGLKGEVGKKEG
jgi:hypothetical protein